MPDKNEVVWCKDDEDEDLKSCSLFFEFFPLSPSEKLI